MGGSIGRIRRRHWGRIDQNDDFDSPEQRSRLNRLLNQNSDDENDENDENNNHDESPVENNLADEILIDAPIRALETVEGFEDEIDAAAYDDLIPAYLRATIEEDIFGWDHALSTMLGYMLFVMGGWFLTFWTFSLLLLRRIVLEIDDSCNGGDSWNFWERINSNASDGCYEPYGTHMSPNGFRFLRASLSAWMALSAYRMVQRRRSVWLRSGTYGSSRYLRDTDRRRKSVSNADRSSILGLGRKRDAWRASRVRGKLKKAEGMFERSHEKKVVKDCNDNVDGVEDMNETKRRRRRRRRRRVGGLSGGLGEGWGIDEVEHHDRVKSLGKYQNEEKSSELWNFDNSSGGSIFYDDQDDAYGIIMDNEETDNEANFFRKPPVYDDIETVASDQMYIPNGKINNVPYVHGSFFGAAPFMLADPHWIDKLRHLMPDVYVAISSRILHTPTPKLILWAENNPVVAAYGSAYEVEYMGKVPTLEWDVFLDPSLVHRVQIVLDARNQLLATAASVVGRGPAGIAATITSLPPSERAVLRYYDDQINSRVNALLEDMLIAHGNVTQLAMEQIGLFKKLNFSRVRRTCRTLGGGISAKHWLAIYTKALWMSMGCDGEKISKEEEEKEMKEGKEGKYVSTAASVENVLEMTSGNTLDQTSGKHKSSDTASSDSAYSSSVPTTDGEEYNNGILDFKTEVFARASAKITNSCSSFEELNSFSQYSDESTTCLKAYALPTRSTTSITESITLLKKILQCEAPIGLVLDLKSRHVQKQVWALVIDALRDAGARVEGIASFYDDEIRDITQLCSAPVKEIVFCHSAGDLQKSCHDGRIRMGDTVCFNAGSLIWSPPLSGDEETNSVLRILNCASTFCRPFDADKVKRGYQFQQYARIRKGTTWECSNSQRSSFDVKQENESDHREKEDQDLARLLVETWENGDDSIHFRKEAGSTVQDYKTAYNLSIGLYVQEFAIDDTVINLLTKYVNNNPHVYDLGLSWGGVNGVTVRGIQPGRFTYTDGFWKQRHAGYRWNNLLSPESRIGDS